MEKGGTVYIITNLRNTTLYTGVTSNLQARIAEHIYKVYPKSFTARYNICKLVYFEFFSSIEEAINFEKRIKSNSRQFKIDLINSVNPKWNDLYELEVSKW